MYAAARRLALSLVELLVVVGILAIVATVGAFAVGRGSAHRDAAALSRTVMATRWFAVNSGAPSALVAQGAALFRTSGEPLHCESLPEGAPVWEPSRPLVLTWPASSVAFGVHGRPLRCDGSAVGNTTITLTGRDGSSAAVIISSLGRVRWERR